MSSNMTEEELEQRNMIKGLFPVMKTWYHSSDIAPLRAKYGDYPLFWQDLETWQHLKILKKVYLSYTERKEAREFPLDCVAIEESIVRKMNAPVQEYFDDVDGGNQETTIPGNNLGNESQAPQKRKRNRWGTEASAAATESTTLTEGSNMTSDIIASIQAAKMAAEAAAANSASVFSGASQPTCGEIRKPKVSRFSKNVDVPVAIAAVAPQIPPQELLQQSIVLKVQLQSVNDRLMTVVQDAIRIEADPDRSPSPPPRYDKDGKRTNTREIRMREKLSAERAQLIEELLKLNPGFLPPVDFIKQKPIRRIYIPPNNAVHNYIGLIIGPRGNTQKEMEQKSGCKISIRGKGSVKEGSKGRATKQVIDEDEELHVHIQGETEANVEIAVKLVQEILNPSEEDLQAHKQKQLRELALINGTLREDEFCPVCGEPGHKQYECPHRAKTFKAASVKCSICGDLSHPTRDCPLKQASGTNEVFLDSEYDSFMAELGQPGSARPDNSGVPGGSDSSKPAQVVNMTSMLSGQLPPPTLPSVVPSSTVTSATGSTATTVDLAAALQSMASGAAPLIQPWMQPPPQPVAYAPAATTVDPAAYYGGMQYGYNQGYGTPAPPTAYPGVPSVAAVPPVPGAPPPPPTQPPAPGQMMYGMDPYAAQQWYPYQYGYQ